jgi:tetrahydromethanopterin S-methyltransferase subunit G
MAIILIQDVIDLKKRKEQELKMYQERLDELQVKISFLKQEIELTQRIIKMIKREEVIEVNRWVSNNS